MEEIHYGIIQEQAEEVFQLLLNLWLIIANAGRESQHKSHREMVGAHPGVLELENSYS